LAQSKQWKVWERECAKDLGGTRTGPRGFGLPDVADIPIALEAKYMQALSLRGDHLKQAQTNANGLPWALALREAKTGRRVAVCDWSFFVELYNAWRETDG
jgi:hypothetical protein